ncbi:serine hydrolase domain-containing protein [Brevibacterium senegalense]|uniref:serine hydrolase domain-containing protein n=1 Tax=Brevibacterium senegalense TaxID=1033736 RepID=UPI00031CB952|nr:serine hydrolase [Brevibacterium senegalense]
MEKRLATWMSPESNRWSFTHVREVIPTARIARGETTTELGEAAHTLDPSAALPDLGVPLDRYLAETHTDSIVVLADGRVSFEWYADGKSGDDLHINFSVSKSLTGLVAWALASEGAFSFADRVTDYVPEVTGSAYDVTIQSLFDMAVPLDFSEDYAMGDPRMLDYRRSTGWIPGESEGLHAFLPTLQRRADEGAEFHYASPTTDMAGWLLERVSGRRLAELYSTYVWQPIGAASDADITVDPFGAGRAAGGISCTTRDLARVGHHLVDGGGVFGEDFLRDLHSGDAARWQAYANIADFPRGSYRNFWYVPDTDAAVLYGVGIHGQGLYVDVERRIVIAKHSSWPVPITDALHTAQYSGMRDLAALVAA